MPETLTKPAPELITGMPDAAELHRRFGPSSKMSHEPMRPGLYAGYTEGGEDVFKQTLVRNLRDELAWGNPQEHDRLVGDGYAVARELGDGVVGAESEDAFTLLDATRTAARTNTRFHSISGESRGGYVDSEHEGVGRREVGVAVEESYQGSTLRRVAESRLASMGVTIDPLDLGVFIFLQNTGHESAHSVQLGVADALRSTGKLVDGNIHHRDKTASAILMSHPEEGLTGNLETDIQIHDERFAEGYGLEVMSEAARLLGYDQQTIDMLKLAIGYGERSRHPHLLAEVTKNKSLEQVYAEHDIKGNPGEVGYTRPLSKAELVKELKSLHDTLTQPGLVAVDQERYAHRHGPNTTRAVHETSPKRHMSHREKVRAIGRHSMRLLGRRRS